jgi:Tol biopolymer transport system component
MRWATGLTLLVASLAWPIRAGFSQTRPANVTLEEIPLASTAGYQTLKSFVTSADAQHLAFLAIKEDKQYVVRDGKENGPYEWVIPSSLTLSPVDARVAYITQEGNDMSVVVGGQIVGKSYYRICLDRIKFSDDGKHYAYTAQIGNKGAVVVRDGVAGKMYQEVPVPLFSPGGAHLACYVTLESGKKCVIYDGQEQKAYDGIAPGSLQFSHDGNHFAYTAIQNRRLIAVVDGKEISKPLDALYLVFSPAGDHIAYFAGLDKQYSVMLDGKSGPNFDGFAGAPVFSPDGKHLAYVASRQKEALVVLDGIGQKPFDEVSGESIEFSPDSNHLAYAARKGNERFVVLDGKRLISFDYIARPGILFSKDGKRLAYSGVRGRQFVMVCDGVEGPRYDEIVDMSFSPDGKHFAYRAVTGQQPLMVLNSQPSPPYDALTPVTFSPDGAHWIYMGRRNGSDGSGTASIVVDGADAPKSYTGFVVNSRAAFASPDTADLLMLRGNDVLRVRVHCNPGAK